MSKEHSYAYEAGYRDGSINYELEHCPACKNVADLQEALDENAKLRELCRDVFAYEAIDCERCAYGERCKAHETTCYTAGIIIRKRARDLGVDDV